MWKLLAINQEKCSILCWEWPYFPFSVPYGKIFFNNFLHLLLNRCDVKLNPVFIYGSVFTSLQHFLVVVIIFPWLLTPTPVKNGESYSFGIAITWIWRVFHNLSSDEWYREPTPTRGLHCPQRLLSCSCYETQLRIVRVR